MFYFPVFLLVRFWILSRNGHSKGPTKKALTALKYVSNDQRTNQIIISAVLKKSYPREEK